MSRISRAAFLCLPLLLCLANSANAEEKKAAKGKVSYYNQIRRIFQAHCQGCHQPAKAAGNYVMTNFKRLLQGGESEEKAIVPGKPNDSNLVSLITPTKGKADMPKDKPPLSPTEIKLIRKWISEGAKDDTPKNAIAKYDTKNPPKYSAPPVITSLDFSSDGKLMAIAGFHEVLIHKADGKGLVARLIGISDRIETVRFSPDAKKLVVAGGNPSRMGEIQIWDVAKRKLTLSHPITYDTVYGANWSPDGKLISFGCSDNTVRVIRADNGKQVMFLGSHNDWIRDTVFSLKGTHVISVGRDRSVKLTELATQRFIDNVTSITPNALKGGVAAVDRHPTSDAVVVGGADGVPKIYRMFRESKRVIGDDANLIKRLPALPGRIIGVAFSPDGKYVAAGSSLNGKGTLGIYKVDFKVKLPPDLKKIVEVVASRRKPANRAKLRKSRAAGVKMIARTEIFESGLYAVAYNKAGNRIAAAGADGRVRLFDSSNGKLVHSFVPVPIDAGSLAASKRKQPVPHETSPAKPEKITAVIPTKAKLVKLEVLPKAIRLDRPYDSIQMLVTGKLNTGDSVDLTRVATRKLSSPVINISSGGLVRSLKNGKASLELKVGKIATTVAVDIANVGKGHPMSYVRDVAPVISKMGCNAGTCHGSKDGKNGFKLSLRGYDPLYDVRAFTDDLASRRVNLASPDDSLMLLKATNGVPHVGGQLTLPSSPYYEVVRGWISKGAKLDRKHQVTKIEVTPQNPIVQNIGGKQQMRIIATYASGEKRDVTSEAFVESGNVDVVAVDGTGLVSTMRRGEAAVLARYEGAYAATTITVMGDRSSFKWEKQPSNNYIDKLVAVKWKRMKILPSRITTDAEFVRRLYIDLTGLPPTAKQVKTFLSDKRPTNVKRNALVDSLIGNNDFVDHWTNKWADLLQVNRKYLAKEGADSFRKWIRNEVSKNTPYDKFAYKILTASGSNKENPAAAYYKILRNPVDIMENTTHLFLAIRFNCNKCHDHPFERWTQDQYYETAAFFAQVGLKRDPASKKRNIGGTAVERPKPLYEVVFDAKKGDIKHARTGNVTAPDFPYTAKHSAKKGVSRRERIARWITSKDNQYFARSYVNRVWGYLMGVGLIEPLDDIRAGNPPSNPELLDALTKQFIESGFNVRELIRTVCKSRTYQLAVTTTKWNADDSINYSHATARRLPAEVLYDAIHRVTGSVSNIPGVPKGTRAAALPDAGVKLKDGFLANFGRPPRESACECERSSGMQLGPVLALVTGPTLNSAISDPQNAIAKLASSKMSNAQLVDELYLRILNRRATTAERDAGVKAIEAIPAEHKQLIAELNRYRKSIAPRTAKREKVRQIRIAKAKATVVQYKKKMAAANAAKKKARTEAIHKQESLIKGYLTKMPQNLAKWEAKRSQTVWVPLRPTKVTSTFGTKFDIMKDNSVFASGNNGKGSYNVELTTKQIGITAIRLELLKDKRLPKNGPGRFPDGNFVLNEFILKAAAVAKKPKKKMKVQLKNAKADFSQANFQVRKAIDGNIRPINGWASAPRLGENRTATFELAKPLGGATGSKLCAESNRARAALWRRSSQS